ncbi:MAG: nucleotidyltransferase family protein [Anaerolineae bacterium]|nr:nucleotidyltransferase family protein [Anaerolineae bacterium]
MHVQTVSAGSITVPYEALAAFCRRHRIRKLSLFGSVLGGDVRPDSDVDVLVEFDAGHAPGLFQFVDMQDELTALLGREADLNTPAFLSRHMRRRVLDSAQVLYERAG